MTQNLHDELVAAQREAARIQRESDAATAALKHRNDELAGEFEVHKSTAKQAQAEAQEAKNRHGEAEARNETERRLRAKAEDDLARAQADLEAAHKENAVLRQRLARVVQVAEGK